MRLHFSELAVYWRKLVLMEPMQFWTKLVKSQHALRLRLSEVGGTVMFVSFCLIGVLDRMGKSVELALIGIVAGLCLVLMGRILRGSKRVRPLATDTDIVISTREIRIGDQVYATDKVEYLDFLVNSYEGMQGPMIRWRRMKLQGTDNKLQFTTDGKKHSYGFYLEDNVAMRRLGLLFREFYREGIRFRERNRGGRTFMFEQVVDRQAFEEAKRREGYE
jgi:hypothetical protein